MAKAAPLFREALATHKNKISEIVEKNTESISLDRNEAEEAQEKSSGLFDPTAEAFTSSFNVTISLLVTVIVVGLIWHFGRYRRNIIKKEREMDELQEKFSLLRITEFLKSDGRNMLKDFTATLVGKIKSLQEKHIRQRKNINLFKAEIKRKKADSVIFEHKRRPLRVSPELNAGMDYNERSTANRRGSSLSVFADGFKKQRSSQVHPVEESLSNESFSRSSSIELKDLVKSTGSR